ncbi:Hypothetical protein EHI5A_026170 [Entamoeba histolytica KU27]|uniref:Uncharacterized protein n=1 Tax=Entamoeba histolytica KU27 TaxID=885311 RepID=M2Q9E7_ENTHI|nr:Hypothetical protein EHI5A_026170 [Entamoeba histolytica KU27]
MSSALQIKYLLENIGSCPQNEIKKWCDDLINMFPLSTKSFKSFYLPIYLDLNGVQIRYTIDTNSTLFQFTQEISNRFKLPQPLHMNLGDPVDHIYFGRKISSFILFPNQIITIKTESLIEPTMPKDEYITFPWIEYFKTFDKLLSNSNEYCLQLLRTLSSIPLDQFVFDVIDSPSCLTALFFNVLKERTISLTEQQCINLIKQAFSFPGETKYYSIISVLRLCVFNNIYLPENFIEEIKQSTQKESKLSLIRPIYIYLGCCVKKDFHQQIYLPNIKDCNEFQIINAAQHDFELDDTQLLSVYQQITTFINSPQKHSESIEDLFETPLYFIADNNTSLPFSENFTVFSYLYLLNSLVKKYGFKNIPRTLGEYLVSFVLPQWKSCFESIPLLSLGFQSINLAHHILSYSNNLKSIVSKYLIKSCEIQSSLGRIELTATPRLMLENPQLEAYIYIASFLSIENGEDNSLVSVSKKFLEFPPRSIDITPIITTLQIQENDIEGLVRLLNTLNIKCSLLNFSSISTNIIPILCYHFYFQVYPIHPEYTYAHGFTSVPKHFDLFSTHTLGNLTFSLKAVITVENKLYLRNGNKWMCLENGILIDVNPKVWSKIMREGLFTQIVLKVGNDVVHNPTTIEPTITQTDISDASIRTSVPNIECMSVEEKIEFLKYIICRYLDVLSSEVYYKVCEELKKENGIIVLKYILSDKFLNFFQPGETLNEVRNDLVDLVVYLMKKLDKDSQNLICQLLITKTPNAGMLRLCSQCTDNETIKEYSLQHFNDFFKFVKEEKQSFQQLIKETINELDKLEPIYRNNVEIIRTMKKSIPVEASLILKRVGNKEERTNMISSFRFLRLDDLDKIKFLESLDLDTMTSEDLSILQKYKKKLTNESKEVFDKFDQINKVLKQRFDAKMFYDYCYDAFYDVMMN